MRALLTAGAVVGAVCAADYAFVTAGGLTWAATPGASAIRASAATLATLVSAYVWSKFGGMASAPGALAMCVTYAFGSLLSIVVVQAYKVSATCVLSAGAACAATCAAAWLVRTLADSSMLEGSYDAQVHAQAMARGAKSFERLEALREVMMREFEAEMAELEQKQSQFAMEMSRVEERHKREIARLQMDITKLRDQNNSHAADKAKALEQAKAQFEAEKRRMREAHERDTALLKETISKLETEVAGMEGKFADERNDLLSKVRAAKALYQAQRAMMYSEVSKLQKAISVKEAQAADWHAKVTAIEAEKLSLISKLEEAAANAETSAAELVAAVAEVQFEAERELQRAIAEALAERQALELLMNDKEAAWKVEMRAAITEAEMKINEDSKKKLADLDARHTEAIAQLMREHQAKMQQVESEAEKRGASAFAAEKATLEATYRSAADAAQKAHADSLERTKAASAKDVEAIRAEMAVLKATYESAAAAAQTAHARSLELVKEGAAQDLVAAKQEIIDAVAEQIHLNEIEKMQLVAEMKEEELEMTAELLAEKDAAIAELQKQLKMSKNERRAVFDLLKSESEKMKMFTGDNLKKEIESAEERLNLFWSGKMERLGAAHAVKVEKMEKDTKSKVRQLKEDAKQELAAQLEFTAKATRVAAEAELEKQLANATRSMAAERRALKALFDSETSKTQKLVSSYESRINALEIAEKAAKEKAQAYDAEIDALKKQSQISLESALASREAEVEKTWLTKMDELERAHKVQIERINADHAKAIAESQSKLKSAEAAQAEAIKAKMAQLETDLAKTTKSLEDQLAAAREDAARQLAAEKSRTAEAIQAAAIQAEDGSAAKKELDALTAKFSSTESEYKSTVQKLEAEIKALELKAAAAGTDAKAQFEAEIATLNAKLKEAEEEIKELESQLSEAKSAAANKVAELEKHFADEMHELRSAFDAQAKEGVAAVSSERDALSARIAALEAEHDQNLSLAKADAEKAKASAVQSLADVDAQISARLAEQKAELDAKLAAQIEELRKRTDADVAAASKALADAKAQYEADVAALKAQNARDLTAAKEAAESADAVLLSKISKLETEQKSALQKAKEQVEAEYGAKLTKAQAEIDALKAKLADAEKQNAAQAEKELADALTKAALIPGLQQQVDELTNSLTSSKASYESTLNKLQQDHAAEIDKLNKDHVAALKDASDASDLKAQISALEAQLQSEKDKLAKSLTDAEAQRAELEASSKTALERARSQVIAQAEDQRKKLEQMFLDESAKARAAFEAEVAEYEKLVKQATADLKKAHADELSSIVAQHKSELSQALAKVDTTSAGKVTALEAEKAKLEKAIADTNAALTKASADAKSASNDAASAKAALEKLEQEVASLTNARDAALARASELEKEGATLTKNAVDPKELATLATARDAAQARVAELEKSLAAIAEEKSVLANKLSSVDASKAAEMQKLKDELAQLQADLTKALANAQNQRASEIARLTADFESKYASMQQKHESEIDELSRQALVDVSSAEKRADVAEAEIQRLRSETKDVATYKSQIETNEKQLIIVREKLGATEKKLADFLALYGEERKVLEESRKIADDLDRIKRRYATSMEIDESTIDEISSKVEKQLAAADDGEKMQAMMDGRAKGDTVVDVRDIPVWAYYALGVATAILPRIIAGGL